MAHLIRVSKPLSVPPVAYSKLDLNVCLISQQIPSITWSRIWRLEMHLAPSTIWTPWKIRAMVRVMYFMTQVLYMTEFVFRWWHQYSQEHSCYAPLLSSPPVQMNSLFPCACCWSRPFEIATTFKSKLRMWNEFSTGRWIAATTWKWPSNRRASCCKTSRASRPSSTLPPFEIP